MTTEKIGQIIEVFENFLNNKNIILENKEREKDQEDDPFDKRSNIYGEDYYLLEDSLKEILTSRKQETSHFYK